MNDIEWEAELDWALIEKARKDILAFTLATKDDYEINWHHRELCKKLNAFARGEIRFLMVFMPPRHGKSEVISRRFPAFLHGIYPDAEIMAASYLDSLAGDMTVDVQNIIDSPMYQNIFPDTKIFPSGTKYSIGTRNSSEHHIVGRKGKYRGQGIGGSFTGKGANFCFPAGTNVLTPCSGQIPIEMLNVGDEVWSFSHESGLLERKRISAISVRTVSKLVQIETTDGRKVLSTPEHPFFTKQQGYIYAERLTRGHTLCSTKRCDTQESHLCHGMYPLWTNIRKRTWRVCKAVTEGASRFLLWFRVFQKSSQLQKQQSSEVLQLWGQDHKTGSKILLTRLQGKAAKTEKSACRTIMQSLWDKVHSQVQSSGVLLNVLQRFPPLHSNGRKKQSEIQGRDCESVSDTILQDQTIDNGQRFKSMRDLWVRLQAARTSYRRTKKQQFAEKPHHSLQFVSHYPPQIESDTVSAIEIVSCKKVPVYDIEVEGNHNFFAENLLVHNCIIDDPIKGREIADSLTFRDRLWNFYNNDLFSRLETNLKTGRLGQILITQTRWHEDDLSGRLIELMQKDPNAVQWDIVNYPAIRVDMDTPSDPRQIGEPLWPKKYGFQQLNQIKASIGTRAWGSLYQQTPVPDEGGLFKEEMFKFVDLPNQFDWTFITADTSYKEKQENDFTVFTSFGVIVDELYVTDVWMAQIKAADVELIAESFIRKNIKYGFRGAYIEPKGHGIYLNQKFATKGLMIPSEADLKEFYSDRRLSKVERANNVVPHLSHRSLFINNALSNKEDLVAQCLGFPKVKHDDFVDTLIDGLKMIYSRQIGLLDVL